MIFFSKTIKAKKLQARPAMRLMASDKKVSGVAFQFIIFFIFILYYNDNNNNNNNNNYYYYYIYFLANDVRNFEKRTTSWRNCFLGAASKTCFMV
jgi:hypothetical protein